MATRPKKMFLRHPSFNLNILEWNAGGLSGAKFSELKKTVVEKDVDVLVILEANITEKNMDFYNIKGYTLFGLYKKRQIASGILVAVRKKLTSSFEVVKEMNDKDLAEIVAISVWNGNSLYKIYGVYSPPNNINLNLDNLVIPRNTILVGDFNAASPSWGYTYHSKIGGIVEDFADSNSLTILYNENDPKTFIHHSGSTTNPDLVMISPKMVDYCTKSVIGDLGSGHRMTILTVSLGTASTYSHVKPMWNFRKANWADFTNDLEKLVENIPYNISPHRLASSLTSAILKSAKLNIPRGRNFKYKPFWNEELSEQKRVRDLARVEAEKRAGKTRDEHRQNVIIWRRECALMKRKINEAKRQSWNDFLNKMDYRTDAKKAYNLLNNLNNKRKDRANHPMKTNGIEITDPKIIADKFNKYFLNKNIALNPQRQKKRCSGEGNALVPTQQEICRKNFSIEELNNAINCLKVKKQPGPDNIFPEFLKHLGQVAKTTLLTIFNSFWSRSINFPSDWIKATVIPIYKKDKSTSEFASYRPISLTSQMAKTFERMLITRLKFFLETNDIVDEDQAGFRKGMSTSNSIMKLVHAIKSGFNSKKSTLAVFVDFQGAYDTICRKRLLNKLNKIGVKDEMLNWIKRFLTQRWVRVRWNEVESKYRQSKIGLPQGSVSSPILFNVYVNDLIKRLKNIGNIQVCMFADDLVIWTEADNNRNYGKQQVQLENVMNKALETLQSWAGDNQMIINKSKTKFQFFTLRHVAPEFELYLDETLIEKSNNTRYLGATLDNKLSFLEYINITKTKVEKRLPMLKRLAGAKWGCSQATLNHTFNAYIKPIIRYGSELLITAAQTKIEILERVQNKALRIITGAVKTTPIEAMRNYTFNPPVTVDIKRQALNVYAKLKVSKGTGWLLSDQPSSLKTQISPIVACEKLLDDLDANFSIESTENLVNPLEFLEVPRQLNMDDCGKKDTLAIILKTTALRMLEDQYPEPEWVRVFTDGSKIDDSAGAGVYSSLFSIYAPVGCHLSNFDAEIYAISLAVENLKSRLQSFSRAVILVDSRSAIESIALQGQSESTTVTRIKQDIGFLNKNGKYIIFQWIPSHVGIDGNEKADLLAKKGTEECLLQCPIPLDSFRRIIRDKIMSSYNNEYLTISRGKTWENIRKEWKRFNHKTRKEAVANFRLETGHDCLAEHLAKIGIVNSDICTLCRTGTMNKAHLLVCSELNSCHQQNGDLCTLYWMARNLMS